MRWAALQICDELNVCHSFMKRTLHRSTPFHCHSMTTQIHCDNVKVSFLSNRFSLYSVVDTHHETGRPFYGLCVCCLHSFFVQAQGSKDIYPKLPCRFMCCISLHGSYDKHWTRSWIACAHGRYTGCCNLLQQHTQQQHPERERYDFVILYTDADMHHMAISADWCVLPGRLLEQAQTNNLWLVRYYALSTSTTFSK